MIPIVCTIIISFTVLGLAGIITQSRERSAKIASENWLTAQREMAQANRNMVRDQLKHSQDQ